MSSLTANEIRSRVESDWNRIVKVLSEKVALQSISANGITAEHMRRSVIRRSEASPEAVTRS